MEGLGISLPILLAQIINFVILFGLLFLVAYKPLMRMLDERSNKIKESMEQTELIKEQAAHAEEEVKKQLGTAAKEGQEVIVRAMRTGEEVRQKAQQEAKLISAKAERDIASAKNHALKELYEQTTELATEMAAGIIGKTLTPDDHRELLQESLNKLQDTTKKR